jgi:hypothetical protein
MHRLTLLRGALLVALAIGIVAFIRDFPRSIQGEGVLYGHWVCMGIALNAGEGYAISEWPAGLRVRAAPMTEDRVVVDADGRVRYREGERVSIQGVLSHGSGDTPCGNTNILRVTRIEPAP